MTHSVPQNPDDDEAFIAQHLAERGRLRAAAVPLSVPLGPGVEDYPAGLDAISGAPLGLTDIRKEIEPPPVPYEIIDTATGAVVQSGELPADHPVIQALNAPRETYKPRLRTDRHPE